MAFYQHASTRRPRIHTNVAEKLEVITNCLNKHDKQHSDVYFGDVYKHVDRLHYQWTRYLGLWCTFVYRVWNSLIEHEICLLLNVSQIVCQLGFITTPPWGRLILRDPVLPSNTDGRFCTHDVRELVHSRRVAFLGQTHCGWPFVNIRW